MGRPLVVPQEDISSRILGLWWPIDVHIVQQPQVLLEQLNIEASEGLRRCHLWPQTVDRVTLAALPNDYLSQRATSEGWQSSLPVWASV